MHSQLQLWSTFFRDKVNVLAHNLMRMVKLAPQLIGRGIGVCATVAAKGA